jgi:hypothetical protein
MPSTSLAPGLSITRPRPARCQDEANFWVATFAHRHDIVWDIIARDTLLPLAFVALIVVALALRQLVGYERPEAQLMVALLIVGGTLSVIADLIFLGDAEFWRLTGWSAHPAATMVAVGRASQAIDLLTRWPEAAGFAILAPGVLCLGRLCRISPGLPTWVGTLAYVEGPLLLGIAVAGVAGWDTAYQAFSLVVGALIAPSLGLGLGRAFERLSHPVGSALAEISLGARGTFAGR